MRLSVRFTPTRSWPPLAGPIPTRQMRGRGITNRCPVAPIPTRCVCEKQGGGDTLWARKQGIPNIVVSEKGLFCAGPQDEGVPCRGHRTQRASRSFRRDNLAGRKPARRRVCRRPHNHDGAGPAVTVPPGAGCETAGSAAGSPEPGPRAADSLGNGDHARRPLRSNFSPVSAREDQSGGNISMASTSRFGWVAWLTQLRAFAVLTLIVSIIVFGYLQYLKFEQRATKYRRLAGLCGKKQRIYDGYGQQFQSDGRPSRPAVPQGIARHDLRLAGRFGEGFRRGGGGATASWRTTGDASRVSTRARRGFPGSPSPAPFSTRAGRTNWSPTTMGHGEAGGAVLGP